MLNITELNTDNPEYYSWQYEQLQIGILGGLKIEGLDRMRITLKIEWKQLAVRHRQCSDCYLRENKIYKGVDYSQLLFFLWGERCEYKGRRIGLLAEEGLLYCV